MARIKQATKQQGFFGIGILNNTNELNIGTLWRSATILGASFIFTVDKQYKRQGSDVLQSWKQIPLYHYRDIENLLENIPYDTQLIGVEQHPDAIPLITFKHPNRAIYLLGNEQIGLGDKHIKPCQHIVELPGENSLNVAVAGSLLMYDRVCKIAGR